VKDHLAHPLLGCSVQHTGVWIGFIAFVVRITVCGCSLMSDYLKGGSGIPFSVNVLN